MDSLSPLQTNFSPKDIPPLPKEQKDSPQPPVTLEEHQGSLAVLEKQIALKQIVLKQKEIEKGGDLTKLKLELRYLRKKKQKLEIEKKIQKIVTNINQLDAFPTQQELQELEKLGGKRNTINNQLLRLQHRIGSVTSNRITRTIQAFSNAKDDISYALDPIKEKFSQLGAKVYKKISDAKASIKKPAEKVEKALKETPIQEVVKLEKKEVLSEEKITTSFQRIHLSLYSLNSKTQQALSHKGNGQLQSWHLSRAENEIKDIQAGILNLEKGLPANDARAADLQLLKTVVEKLSLVIKSSLVILENPSNKNQVVDECTKKLDECKQILKSITCKELINLTSIKELGVSLTNLENTPISYLTEIITNLEKIQLQKQ